MQIKLISYERLVLKQRHRETHALRAYIELWMHAGSLGTSEKVFKVPRGAVESSLSSFLTPQVHP